MPKIKVNGIEIEATQELLQKVQEALRNPKQTAKELLLDYMSKPFEVMLTKGYITYYRDGQWVFQQDLKNKYLLCYYYEVWEVFEKNFSMKYEEIKALHMDVVGEALNCREFTPIAIKSFPTLLVGEALNCREFTPYGVLAF